MGWIAVQLDGCLAVNAGGELRPDVIGTPVAEMVLRVRGWLRRKVDVRILTPRASMGPLARHHVQEWTKRHLGRALRVTDQVDAELSQLWAANAVGVIPNTGRPADAGPYWA